MKNAVSRIAYPRYLKAVRVTLVSLGFDKEWVNTDFRDALEAQYLEGYHGPTKINNVQINISIPSEWKKQLKNLARIYCVEEGTTITFLDLMRRGIQEKYQLGETDDER